ncbi:MAG: hypothetical protein VKI81_02665 [Synechococcaceae cyanobacterium]|nr:hypothetical protein [Synechococcaceae cyanobacterium]
MNVAASMGGTAIEDPNPPMAEMGKGPPQARRAERHAHVVVGHDERVIPDAQPAHRPGKPFRGSQHVRHGVVRVGEVCGHSHEHRSGNAARRVTVTVVEGDLAAVHPAQTPADIDDPQVRILQVGGQPLRRDERR